MFLPLPTVVDCYNAQPALKLARSIHPGASPRTFNPWLDQVFTENFGLRLSDPRIANQTLLRTWLYGPLVAEYALGSIRDYLELSPAQAECLHTAIVSAYARLILDLEPFLHPRAVKGHTPRQTYVLFWRRMCDYHWDQLALTDEQFEHYRSYHYWMRVTGIDALPLLRQSDAEHLGFDLGVDLDNRQPLVAFTSVAVMQALLAETLAELQRDPAMVPMPAFQEFSAIVLGALLDDLPHEILRQIGIVRPETAAMQP